MIKRYMAGAVLVLMAACGQKIKDDGIDFTIVDLEGQSQTFSQFRGKTVLLNVWATWCAPCIKEIPDLQDLHSNLQEQRVVILGVLLDSKSPEAAKPMVEKLAISYPTWYGDDDFARQFQIAVFPTTFIIDSTGKVVGRFDHAMGKAEFERALEKAM